jgi:hypothetical protein
VPKAKKPHRKTKRPGVVQLFGGQSLATCNLGITVQRGETEILWPRKKNQKAKNYITQF